MLRYTIKYIFFERIIKIMEKNQLIYVLYAAKYKSITQAAEKLFISQPSLSNQIIKLENEIGIKLFERRHQKIELTEAGRAFIEHAQVIINSFNKLEKIMGEYASMNKGTLTVGILPVTTSLKILDYIYEFQEEFPNIDIFIKEIGSLALVNMMLKREIDVAFAILSEEKIESLKSEFNILKIRKDKITVVVNNKHRLARKKSVNIEDLAGENLIFSNNNFQFPKLVTDYMENKNIPFTTSCQCTQLETTFSLVEKNFGITLCSELTTNENLTTGRYKDFEIKSVVLTPAIERSIYMIFPKNVYFYPTIDNFVKFIKNKYNIN